MITDKVRPHHLERKVLLYVRQSSAHQVLHNRESSAADAMRDRLNAHAAHTADDARLSMHADAGTGRWCTGCPGWNDAAARRASRAARSP